MMLPFVDVLASVTVAIKYGKGLGKIIGKEYTTETTCQLHRSNKLINDKKTR